MKKHIIRLCAVWLAVCMVCTCAACGRDSDSASSGERGSRDISNEIPLYYGTYGNQSDKTLDERLDELEEEDPAAAAKWRSIIELWKTSNSDLVLHYGVLPDGLPETDEFCMVVLGFQLNADGTMREELLDRLKVAKASAEKYPNALVVCTGGHTASGNRDASEAGNMAEWLIRNGIAANRVIVEDKSLTTAQNAMYSLDILAEQYPQVKKLAVISSDYHIATGHLLFGAEATLRAEEAGKEHFTVISNAACKVPGGSLSATFQVCALTELSGDGETAWKIYYEKDDVRNLPPLDD